MGVYVPYVMTEAHTDAGSRRQQVMDEFESEGFNIDAKPHDGDVVIKPYEEPGTDGYDEFVAYLKQHDAIVPRDDPDEWENHIFVYDGDALQA